MEGEADRREDGDSPEGQSDALDGYRDEIMERYPDSGKDCQGEAQSDARVASWHVDGDSETKSEEDASKDDRSLEQYNQSSDVKEKYEPRAEVPSDTADDEGRTAEFVEQNAEPESRSELEQLRDDIRETYPQGEVNESDEHDESDRISRSEDEDAKGSNSQASRSNFEEKSETTREKADEDSVETAPEDGGQGGVAGEQGKQSSDVGGKIDSSHLDSGNDLQVESPAKEAESHNREEVVVEQAAPSIPEGQRIANETSMPHVRDKVEGNRDFKVPSKERPEKHVEANDTSFVANETKGGPSLYLRIPDEHIDKFGKDEVLEARVARMSAPEREFYLYTSSSYADPHFNISHLNPTPRESFRVLSIKKVELSDFARDFNEHKPSAFGNVALSHSDGKATLKVDNSVAAIRNPKLSVRGQGPILEGSVIEGTNRGSIRIAKESESFSLHFGDYSTNHPRIVHMKGRESYIEVGYVQSSRESDYRTRRVPAVSIEPAKGKFEDEVKNRFTEIDGSNMTKKEIRAWIDTEGNIYSRGMDGKSGPQLAVTQKHREPLDVFARSVRELGVRCKVSRDGHGCYVAKITDTEGVAKIIKEVGPFRTPQKCEQVRQFEEMLKRERKERRRVIERSKTLLGL